jgi:hypothetical protein
MRNAIGCIVVAASLACFGQAKPETGRRVILPNPKLIRCVSSDCYQPWEDKAPRAGDIYPVRVEVGLLGKHCPFGVSAVYDKSVSFEDLQAAIEVRFGKGTPEHWTEAPLTFWQVSDDFSIVLDTADQTISKSRRVDVETKELFYSDARMPTTTCNLR